MAISDLSLLQSSDTATQSRDGIRAAEDFRALQRILDEASPRNPNIIPESRVKAEHVIPYYPVYLTTRSFLGPAYAYVLCGDTRRLPAQTDDSEFTYGTHPVPRFAMQSKEVAWVRESERNRMVGE